MALDPPEPQPLITEISTVNAEKAINLLIGASHQVLLISDHGRSVGQYLFIESFKTGSVRFKLFGFANEIVHVLVNVIVNDKKKLISIPILNNIAIFLHLIRFVDVQVHEHEHVHGLRIYPLPGVRSKPDCLVPDIYFLAS